MEQHVFSQSVYCKKILKELGMSLLKEALKPKVDNIDILCIKELASRAMSFKSSNFHFRP